jgi:hypothetical protein
MAKVKNAHALLAPMGCRLGIKIKEMTRIFKHLISFTHHLLRHPQKVKQTKKLINRSLKAAKKEEHAKKRFKI